MLYLVLIILHLLGDFVFQFDEVIKLKFSQERKEVTKGLAMHIGIITLLNFSVFLYIPFDKTLAVDFLIIAFSHFLIDYAKVYLSREGKPVEALVYFALDQVLHIGIIIFLVGDLYIIQLEKLDKRIAYNFLIYLLCTFTASIVVKMILDYIYRTDRDYQKKLERLFPEDENSILKEVKVGKVIGIIERFILLTLATHSGFSALGFIFAAKSLTRFKMLEKKVFAEYYLLGTLISYLIVIVCYYLLQIDIESLL